MHNLAITFAIASQLAPRLNTFVETDRRSLKTEPAKANSYPLRLISNHMPAQYFRFVRSHPRLDCQFQTIVALFVLSDCLHVTTAKKLQNMQLPLVEGAICFLCFTVLVYTHLDFGLFFRHLHGNIKPDEETSGQTKIN